MYLPKTVVLLIFLTVLSESAKASDDVSFKNVNVEWKSGKIQKTANITSAKTLKEHVPNISIESISVTVSGSVPILYENAISDINNLDSLHLSGIGLKEIQPGAITKLPRLSYLGLNYNNLQQIKSGTFSSLNISTLNLDYNSISTLHPGAFRNLPGLKFLAIRGNQLGTIPSGVFENVVLVKLDLNNNSIHLIEPKAFSKILGLRGLGLSSNKLEQINPEAFDIPELEHLDLDFNSISSLQPGDLGNLPELSTLELVANQLEEIQEGVFNYLKITTLKLNYNNISVIASHAFDNMRNLSVLHIDHNKLTIWDNNWLHDTPSLYYIFAGYNYFEEIPGEAFKNYPRMYNINLNGNKINKISPDAFSKTESIVNLGLSDNEIDQWNENVLANASVGTIDLSDNKLKCIDGDLKTAFRTVHFVHLEGNPWDPACAQKIKEFINYKHASVQHKSL